jgi:PTH1 family peptidyl-tRNA hydrolase
MYIFVGLGNPGKRYSGTRHNIGFDILDIFADKHNVKINKIKHKALLSEMRLFGEKVVLVKPQTYMNLSGDSLLSIFQYYKPDILNVIVVYDDIDIDVGKVRIRKKGSAGSHNGMKSIIFSLKNDEFPRIRVGVGRPERMNLADYVLSRYKKDELEPMRDAANRSVFAMEEIVKNGLDKAMNLYNG